MKGILKYATILVLLANLAGCASSGVVRNASPIATATPVPLDFVLVQTSSSLAGLETEKHQLNEMIITGLRETEIFGSVSTNMADAGPAGGIKVTADIKEITKVSNDARVWFGALAGRARILVAVKIASLNSGNQIQSFEVEGLSGDTARAGTTDEAIQRVAQRVVAELIKISRQTSQ